MKHHTVAAQPAPATLESTHQADSRQSPTRLFSAAAAVTADDPLDLFCGILMQFDMQRRQCRSHNTCLNTHSLWQWNSLCMLNLAPQLCLLLSFLCTTAPFLAALRFSVLLTFSLGILLCFVFFSFHIIYYFLTFYLFSTLCPSCTSLCSSLCVLNSTSQGFIAWIYSTCGFLAQIAFSPSNLSFFYKPSLFPLLHTNRILLINPAGVENNCLVYVSSQPTKGSAEEGMDPVAPSQSSPKATLEWDTG